MTDVTIQHWHLKIDHEATKKAYQEADEQCICLECQNFREASAQLDDAILQFATQLGIDLMNPCRLSAFEVEGDAVMYAGHYCVQGEIIQGEIDAWDIIVGQHCFALTQEGDVTKEFSGETFEISFEVVFPKVLVTK